MAACAAAGVGSGSTEDDVSEDSCASRKRSAGSRVQSVSTSVPGRLSTYGIVVLVERRSERVVKGLSAPLAPPPPPPPPD